MVSYEILEILFLVYIVYFTLRSVFSESLPNIVTRIYLIIGTIIISFLFIFVTLNDIFYK